MSVIILQLCGALVIVSMADAVRLRNLAFERCYERLLGLLMRESEKVARLSLFTTKSKVARSQSSVNGVVWYLVGVIFVLSLYPRDVAVEAILL
jgi:diacylglycerol kinase (CTP)